MKRIIIAISLVLLCMFCFTYKAKVVEAVNVEDLLCGDKNFNKLLSQIRNIKANYELAEKEDGGKYFKIKITNMTKDLILNVYGYNYSYDEMGSDFYLLNIIPIDGGSIPLKFYGSMSNPCAEQYISKKTVVIPKYNIYSELDACVEYEEFPLCAKYYDGEIKSNYDFNEQLAKWIDETKVEYEMEERTIFDIIKEFIEDNQLLVALVISFLVIVLLIFIIRKIVRRIKRTKIRI